VRADAERNRRLAVEGARAVLGERGLQAPLDEIARRAGIGNATLYRHFPTRCELVVAACTDAMAELTGAGELALGIEDPWSALSGYLAVLCEVCARDRAVADMLTTEEGLAPELARLREPPIAILDRLIRRARRAGVVRGDCTQSDIEMILNSTAGLAQRSRDQPEAWRRHLELLLDGLARTPA
jgi:AcrR family transcriptional regulator